MLSIADLVVEEEEPVKDGDDVVRVQKVTLPESGKVIKGRGTSLRQAFSIIQAWNKTTKNLISSVKSEQNDNDTGSFLQVDQDSLAMKACQSNQHLYGGVAS